MTLLSSKVWGTCAGCIMLSEDVVNSVGQGDCDGSSKNDAKMCTRSTTATEPYEFTLVFHGFGKTWSTIDCLFSETCNGHQFMDAKTCYKLQRVYIQAYATSIEAQTFRPANSRVGRNASLVRLGVDSWSGAKHGRKVGYQSNDCFGWGRRGATCQVRACIFTCLLGYWMVLAMIVRYVQ